MPKLKLFIWLFAVLLATVARGEDMEREIYFAGGCFWGVQEYFSRIPGVVKTEAGYANSIVDKPDYQQVCSGQTRAAESVRIVYDPQKVSLAELVKSLFAIIDPLSVNRQGNDRGSQYRTGIYYTDAAQAEELKKLYAQEQGKYGVPLAVELGPLKNFWPAEEYHQDYLKKNPGGYCHINLDRPTQAGKSRVDENRYPLPDTVILQQRLTPAEFAVTRQGATERAFTGAHWDRHDAGIYVDVATGEPLFSSADKFDSGTGWPSFTRAIDPDVILGQVDNSHGMQRIEALSRSGKSHLGHIFADGPRAAGGQRFCINSAALRFIPYADMDKEGYGYLKPLVK